MAQLNTRLVLRNDIYTAWESSNPILLKGEVGVEYNPSVPTEQGQLNYSVKIKIGDGINTWNDLPYFGGNSEIIDDITQEVSNIVNVLGDEETEGTVIYRIGTLEEQLSTKADKTEVEQALAEKADISTVIALEESLDKKANAEDVTNALELKADKTYVDEELAKKAIAEDVTNALTEKANIADVYAKDEVYTKSEVEVYVNNQIGSAGHLKREIVESLPLDISADIDTIYMVKKEGGLIDQDHYEEYMIINGTWEKIGDTYVDLTNYATKEYVTNEIDTVEEAIALKADQTALDTANENIDKKADKSTSLEGYGITDAYTKEEVNVELSLKASQQDHNALVDTVNGKADKATTLAGYGITDAYAKSETYTQTEINTLLDQITGGDTSETAASVKRQLDSYISSNDAAVASITERVQALEDVGADDNIIEAIKIAGESTALEIAEKTVTLPAATVERLGLVKLSAEVGIDDAGALEVKSLDVNKLIQAEGEWLIMNGGTAII